MFYTLHSRVVWSFASSDAKPSDTETQEVSLDSPMKTKVGVHIVTLLNESTMALILKSGMFKMLQKARVSVRPLLRPILS